ncbi:MAG: diguanylate cyclase [Pseudomonadota bacterium]
MSQKPSTQKFLSTNASMAHIGRALLSISVLAILVVGSGAFLLSYYSLHQQTARHLQTLISFAASESVSAIEFRDSKTATEILQSIPPEVGLTAAEIRDESNIVLARLDRQPDGLIGALANLVGMERVEKEVIVEGRRIGSIVLEGGAEPMLRALLNLFAWFVFGMILFAFCALIVGRMYTARFSEPIQQLREIIRRLIEHRDFSQRAPPSSLIEVEDLRREFNILLEEISLRDRRLTQSNEALRRAAYIDVLTGLPNRSMLDSVMQTTIDICKQQHRRACLFYLDIDAFKSINDNFGHAFGDSLLIHIAARLRGWRQQEAVAVRLGGDEFVVLLAPLAEHADLELIRRELYAALEQPFHHQGILIRPRVSIGSAIYPTVADTVEELMHQADQAMYETKGWHHRRGQVTRWRVITKANKAVTNSKIKSDADDQTSPHMSIAAPVTERRARSRPRQSTPPIREPD